MENPNYRYDYLEKYDAPDDNRSRMMDQQPPVQIGQMSEDEAYYYQEMERRLNAQMRK